MCLSGSLAPAPRACVAVGMIELSAVQTAPRQRQPSAVRQPWSPSAGVSRGARVAHANERSRRPTSPEPRRLGFKLPDFALSGAREGGRHLFVNNSIPQIFLETLRNTRKQSPVGPRSKACPNSTRSSLGPFHILGFADAVTQNLLTQNCVGSPFEPSVPHSRFADAVTQRRKTERRERFHAARARARRRSTGDEESKTSR